MLNRRKLMAAGGAGLLIGGGTGAHGAEINPMIPGMTVMIAKRPEGWCVAVPDWEWTKRPEYHLVATKWMPLEEFLAVFDQPEEV